MGAFLLVFGNAICCLAGAGRADPPLPPPSRPEEPRVAPQRGGGIYHQPRFGQSFLDLAEEHAEAKAAGKRFAVIFEQRGSVDCTRVHTEVLALNYIQLDSNSTCNSTSNSTWAAAREALKPEAAVATVCDTMRRAGNKRCGGGLLGGRITAGPQWVFTLSPV